MANPFYQESTTTGAKAPYMCDFHQSQFQLGLAVLLIGAATATYTVEYTYDDPANIFTPASGTVTPVWFPLAALAAKAATLDSTISFPIRAVRINFAAITGTVRFCVIQSGITSNR
jgi:hypothetical protein